MPPYFPLHSIPFLIHKPLYNKEKNVLVSFRIKNLVPISALN